MHRRSGPASDPRAPRRPQTNAPVQWQLANFPMRRADRRRPSDPAGAAHALCSPPHLSAGAHRGPPLQVAAGSTNRCRRARYRDAGPLPAPGHRQRRCREQEASRMKHGSVTGIWAPAGGAWWGFFYPFFVFLSRGSEAGP
jgi:hypothetical protein